MSGAERITPNGLILPENAHIATMENYDFSKRPVMLGLNDRTAEAFFEALGKDIWVGAELGAGHAPITQAAIKGMRFDPRSRMYLFDVDTSGYEDFLEEGYGEYVEDGRVKPRYGNIEAYFPGIIPGSLDFTYTADVHHLLRNRARHFGLVHDVLTEDGLAEWRSAYRDNAHGKNPKLARISMRAFVDILVGIRKGVIEDFKIPKKALKPPYNPEGTIADDIQKLQQNNFVDIEHSVDEIMLGEEDLITFMGSGCYLIFALPGLQEVRDESSGRTLFSQQDADSHMKDLYPLAQKHAIKQVHLKFKELRKDEITEIPRGFDKLRARASKLKAA